MSTFINPFWISNNLNLDFNTIGVDTSTVFVIRRGSDNVEQNFNYVQLTDGTFATFIGVSEGFIKSWTADNGTKLENTNVLYQFKMIVSGGVVYLDDFGENNSLSFYRTINMSQDWVISFIMKDEVNNNNQRCNVSVKQNDTNMVGIAISRMTATNARLSFTINRIESNGVADSYFDFNHILYSLITLSRIGGVIKAQLNNVDKTLTAGGSTTFSHYQEVNSITLGARGQNLAGKITKYKYLGLRLGGDLSAFSLSSFNTAIMTKYSI